MKLSDLPQYQRTVLTAGDRAFLDSIPVYVPPAGVELLEDMRDRFLSPYNPYDRDYTGRCILALNRAIRAWVD